MIVYFAPIELSSQSREWLEQGAALMLRMHHEQKQKLDMWSYVADEDLDAYVVNNPMNLRCGSVCCVLGWMAYEGIGLDDFKAGLKHWEGYTRYGTRLLTNGRNWPDPGSRERWVEAWLFSSEWSIPNPYDQELKPELGPGGNTFAAAYQRIRFVLDSNSTPVNFSSALALLPVDTADLPSGEYEYLMQICENIPIPEIVA